MKVILIVGPSGAGKDTLMRKARETPEIADRLIFVRRYITRAPDANEDNFYVDQSGFGLLSRAGFFIAAWQAHANQYGIPWSEFRDEPENTRICSVSRTAINDFETIFSSTITIEITAHPDILADRLAHRGREGRQDIKKRLTRANMPVKARELLTFDNSGTIAASQDSFLALLAQLT